MTNKNGKLSCKLSEKKAEFVEGEQTDPGKLTLTIIDSNFEKAKAKRNSYTRNW